MEKVGSYLGELGKPTSSASHETDGQEFHKQVLVDYIATFDFEKDFLSYQRHRIFLVHFCFPRRPNKSSGFLWPYLSTAMHLVTSVYPAFSRTAT